MKKLLIGLLMFGAIVVVTSFVFGLIGALAHGPGWLDKPLDNFDYVSLVAIVIALNAIHDYEEH